MDLALITPLILTYNEAPNIGRTLSALTWAKEIVVVDSFSTDETLEILQSHPQVILWQRKFDSFATQCNYGLSKIRTEWVLSLDADYIITASLIEAVKKQTINTQVNGYRVPFKYCIFGKPLRGTLLPPRTVLYRVDQASYENDGHGHRVRVNGICQQLAGYLHHDDRKPLSRWLWAQERYMKLETEKIINTPFAQLSASDKIRKTKIFAPPIVFLYCLILKQGIFDGWQGWYYAWQRTLAEILLAIHLIEAEKLKNNAPTI
ncbi:MULTISPECIES: glycosyltransferase family 2 protein [unclassified Synechocystis]|uniref:glycosyltransferase family 2 protein n=1 Tax=unclassified Synechocystis TaxID=2640012 RepID=UPI000401C395|nr:MULTISPECIES: glycosyltransferase family 2 protein [unclassified Synechocystis]AIE74698.1 glycosyltransferase [Synechocystis sp. PCC 6714]MCT0253947.1 glycosyltransferase family 2 protein [Synechocystis sp. CS-94]